MNEIRLNVIENPYMLLDQILEHLANSTEERPLNKIAITKDLDLGNRDRTIVLIKLKRDGYIDHINGLVNPKEPEGMREKQYFITFEGILFLRDGGYVQQKHNSDLAIDNQKINERLTVKYSKQLNYGTWGLVIVTTLLVFIGFLQVLFSYKQL